MILEVKLQTKQATFQDRSDSIVAFKAQLFVVVAWDGAICRMLISQRAMNSGWWTTKDSSNKMQVSIFLYQAKIQIVLYGSK